MGESTRGGVVLDEAPSVTYRSIPATVGCGGGGGWGSCHWIGGGGGGGGGGGNSKLLIRAVVSSSRLVISVEC
jgi:hypothetical protein